MNTTSAFPSRILVLLTCIALALIIPPCQKSAAQSPPAKQEDMSFASWQAGEYSQAGSDLALTMIASTGAGWISLVVTRYQDTIASTTIYGSNQTPSDADLIHAINRAHALGLKVMLKPHLDLAADPNHWRGEIGQSFTAAQWTAWFASYRAFIDHYAALAEAHGVDQFCVGTELVTTETQSNAWRTTIAGVRSRFSGPLTYASNHGSESHVTWWDALDFIGVDAYYALTDKNDPTLAELRAGWAPHVATLAGLAAAWGKPVLLTEIGYRSVDGVNRQPWDWQVDLPLDLQEQADTYQAAFESLWDQSWLAGIYWWMWDPDPYERGGSCDTDYTPYDKPAEDILRRWYGAPPRYDRIRPQADYSRTQSIYQDSLAAGWSNASWSAVVNYSATNPVHSPPYAISVTAQPWGALAAWHAPFSLSPYYWHEFYVRKASHEQQIRAILSDDSDTELRYVCIDDRRYTDGQMIEPGVWTRVRIPLDDLMGTGRRIQRVAIKNYNNVSSTYYVDDMRLVSTRWSSYLPRLEHAP